MTQALAPATPLPSEPLELAPALQALAAAAGCRVLGTHLARSVGAVEPFALLLADQAAAAHSLAMRLTGHATALLESKAEGPAAERHRAFALRTAATACRLMKLVRDHALQLGYRAPGGRPADAPSAPLSAPASPQGLNRAERRRLAREERRQARATPAPT